MTVESQFPSGTESVDVQYMIRYGQQGGKMRAKVIDVEVHCVKNYGDGDVMSATKERMPEQERI